MDELAVSESCYHPRHIIPLVINMLGASCMPSRRGAFANLQTAVGPVGQLHLPNHQYILGMPGPG